MTCPPESDLLDLMDGRLDDAAAAVLEAHLDRCDMCRGAVVELAHTSVDDSATTRPEREAHGDAGVPPPPVAAAPPAAGTRLAGRFDVVRRLGEGGMGVVYEAYDAQLETPVAIKLLRPDLGGDTLGRRRLHHEVLMTRRVNHPNVCRVHDLAESDGVYFITMELKRGDTLAARLARAPLETDEAIAILVQIAAALEAAHAQGVVHRDLKPGNVMVDATGHATVMDFGLAGDVVGRPGGPREHVGTPAYQAPEQAAGEPATPRSDLYALGLVAWELLAGERVSTRRTPDLARVPEEYRAVVARCLARGPEGRFASAREVARALASTHAAVVAGRSGAQRVETRATAAIVAARVAGAEALAARDEPLATRLVARHQTILRTALHAHNGHEVKTSGDTSLLEFPSAALDEAANHASFEARPSFWLQAAELLAAAGRHTEAITHLERSDGAHFVSPHHVVALPRAWYLLGRSREVVGRALAAAKAYRTLVVIWRDAEPDLAEPRDAAQRLAALVRGDR